MFKIYLIQHIENSKVYVGKTCRDIFVRWADHIRDARRGVDVYFYRAIRKYGPEMFKIRQIDEVETEDLANQREIYWITQIFHSNRPENGYNTTDGGNGLLGWHHSEETKKKISLSNLGKVGHSQTDETKQKLRDFNIGKTLSDDHKRKIGLANSISLKGKQHSEETRRKMSASQTERQKRIKLSMEI
jgi:group I intron endonuclease